ncbi:hypothetical protein [Botrimarina sp.]|uniref:hypothetical protein n=1 Tax=Botrimarina sp. TaxID=2795802 RepID=UPI0032EB6B74
MNSPHWLLVGATAAALLAASPAVSQRGVGEPVGVAQQPDATETVSVSGVLEEVRIGPCEHTTGRSPVGAHLIVAPDDSAAVNVHLGPSAAVDRYVQRLRVGEPIAVEGFTTARLPEGEVVAQKVSQAGTTYVLRDENLRPTWARGPGWRATADAAPPRDGYRSGYGYGYRDACRYGGRGYYRDGYGYRQGPPRGWGRRYW